MHGETSSLELRSEVDVSASCGLLSTVMVLEKLSIGNGYERLVKKIAGEAASAGSWCGRGLASLDVAGQVTDAHVRALFGEGRHPDADRMTETIIARQVELGAKAAHAAEYAARRVALGTRFGNQRGSGQSPLCGYDLVFSPVKSISLAALAMDPDTCQAVQACHTDAWNIAFEWLDRHVAWTRRGRNGATRIPADGLVAAAWTHHTTAHGHPNLTTHVAVVNRVHGSDGRWTSLDASKLTAVTSAASSRYDAILEQLVRQRLRFAFVDEPGARSGTIREVAGIDAAIRDRHSMRTAREQLLDELVEAYRTRHGHAPNALALDGLAKQATITLRNHPPSTAATDAQVPALPDRDTLRELARAIPSQDPRALDVNLAAKAIADRVLGRRHTTWWSANAYHHAHRHLAPFGFTTAEDFTHSADALAEAAVALAVARSQSTRRSPNDTANIITPAIAFRRGD